MIKKINKLASFLSLNKKEAAPKPMQLFGFDLRSYYKGFKSVVIEAPNLAEAKKIVEAEYSEYTASYTGQLINSKNKE